MRKATEQTKATMCVALFNRDLHANSICPANHDVEYGCGWFSMDGKKMRRPDLTAEADEKLQQGFEVLYWPEGNTYVLGTQED